MSCDQLFHEKIPWWECKVGIICSKILLIFFWFCPSEQSPWSCQWKPRQHECFSPQSLGSAAVSAFCCPQQLTRGHQEKVGHSPVPGVIATGTSGEHGNRNTCLSLRDHFIYLTISCMFFFVLVHMPGRCGILLSFSRVIC